MLCTLSLVYVPETTPDAWDAQNIGVSVQRPDAPYGSPGSLNVCDLAGSVAQLMINRV
ncbi:MAG: hypothetical protein WBA97_13280 [Actinophytocola sp.]|uniref:hypothetical protein n=1 Tax=Actinophytocola sp. TaxID=1872138 RepID=UPI003C76C4CC